MVGRTCQESNFTLRTAQVKSTWQKPLLFKECKSCQGQLALSTHRVQNRAQNSHKKSFLFQKMSVKADAETSEFIVRQIRPHIWPKIFTWTYKPQFGKAFTKLQILYIWSVSAIMGFLMFLYVLWNLYLYAYGI